MHIHVNNNVSKKKKFASKFTLSIFSLILWEIRCFIPVLTKPYQSLLTSAGTKHQGSVPPPHTLYCAANNYLIFACKKMEFIRFRFRILRCYDVACLQRIDIRIRFNFLKRIIKHFRYSLVAMTILTCIIDLLKLHIFWHWGVTLYVLCWL